MRQTYIVEGEIAGTRRSGGRVRDEIISRLNALPPNVRLEIDFSRVTVMSGAFADELAGKLMAERAADPQIVFVMDSERVREKLARALERRATAAWTRLAPETQVRLMGAGSQFAAAP